MNWSGGKDSALALYHALRTPELQVTDLLTSVNKHYQRVSMHGVRVELLEAQAQRIGLPLTKLELPEMPDMAEYEQQMRTTLAPLQAKGITHAVFGDIYLEDLRLYRERQLAQIGLAAVFPLWQRPNDELLREYLGLGFRAVVVCVNEKYLDRIFQIFQRLHGKNQFAGTGIGLAICEKVVANHGGAITATSQPGQGSTFSVFLPV